MSAGVETGAGKDDWEPSNQLLLVRSRGRMVLDQLGIRWDVIKEQTSDLFHRSIICAYHEPVRIQIGPGVSYADLARKYGVDRGTVMRWSDETSLPSFTGFCMIAAAEDAAFQRGSHVALNAYLDVFRFVEAKLVEQGVIASPPLAIRDEELLALYHTVRSEGWWKARLTGSKRLLNSAAREISSRMAEVDADHRVRSAHKISQILELWFVPWKVVEAVLHYEWF